MRVFQNAAPRKSIPSIPTTPYWRDELLLGFCVVVETKRVRGKGEADTGTGFQMVADRQARVVLTPLVTKVRPPPPCVTGANAPRPRNGIIILCI